MSIGKYEVWVNPGLHAKQVFVWADSEESAISAVDGYVFSCLLTLIVPTARPVLSNAILCQWIEANHREAQRENYERRERELKEKREARRAVARSRPKQPKKTPVDLPPAGQNDHYEEGMGHVLSRPYRKVRIVEQPEINLPVPLTDMPESASSSSHVLKDEIDIRANAMLQWAPWARRARRSRRYEGYSR